MAPFYLIREFEMPNLALAKIFENDKSAVLVYSQPLLNQDISRFP